MISANSCVCVVSAMDDGNCSPWVICNSSVVQKSIRWKGDLWWLLGGRPQTGFVTEQTDQEPNSAELKTTTVEKPVQKTTRPEQTGQKTNTGKQTDQETKAKTEI